MGSTGSIGESNGAANSPISGSNRVSFRNRITSFFQRSRSASESSSEEIRTPSYKEIKAQYKESKSGLKNINKDLKSMTIPSSLEEIKGSLNQLKDQLSSCKVDQISFSLLNRSEEREKKIGDLAKPIRGKIAELQAKKVTIEQESLKKEGKITSETFEAPRPVFYEQKVSIKLSENNLFVGEDKEFESFKSKIEKAQVCTVESLQDFSAEIPTSKSLDKTSENYQRDAKEAVDRYKGEVEKKALSAGYSLEKTEIENRKAFHLYTAKQAIKSDFLTDRCPIIVSYQDKNETGKELKNRLLAGKNVNAETVFEACKTLGEEIFGVSDIDEDKYKNILDKFPSTEDQNEKKAYVVMHMLSLATQNSLNTLNTNAFDNNQSSRLNVADVYGVVDFKSSVVILNGTTEKMGEGKDLKDLKEFKGMISMNFNPLDQNIVPQTTIEFTGEGYTKENIGQTFSKTS